MTNKMNAPVYISPRVINTINSLPMDDRLAIANAITGEFILGTSRESQLTPMQSIVLAIIRQYVKHDTNKVEFVG